MSLTSPFPYETPVSPETIDRSTGKKSRSPYFSQEHIDWWLEQQQRTERSPERIGAVTLTGQNASISATPVPMPDLSAGLYRVSVFARVTTVATTSSSLTIAIGFTQGGVSCTLTLAAMTGNLVTTINAPFTALIESDANAPITYTVTYASNGAGEMVYTLSVAVEQVQT